MPAPIPFIQLLGKDLDIFSRLEKLILEAELFTRVYEEIINLFESKNKNYFQLLKFDIDKEATMIDHAFIYYIVNDILSSGEYSLTGIASYTQTSEEIIFEIASGLNNNPSLLLSRKIIELHRMMRPNLYSEIFKKILVDRVA